MRQINCYIPIKLRITGRLSDAQLEQLGETLIRTLTERIAFAERAIKNDQLVSETSVIEEVREIIDESRLSPESYAVPTYKQQGERTQLPVRSVSPQSDVLSLNYAFFFTGGYYGKAARDFIKEFYSNHIIFPSTTGSFEEMFELVAKDIDERSNKSKQRIRIDEIVIVTHAHAVGLLLIPLTRSDSKQKKKRFFTPRDLVDLQKEFKDGLHDKFQKERRRVVAALDENTRIVVRGCNFGQSNEGLRALRSFFGGQPMVFAPSGSQGFARQRIGKEYLLKTEEEAFDFLVKQGFWPPEAIDFNPADKKKYIRAILRKNHGEIPVQFFIMGDADDFKSLSKEQQLSPEFEYLKERPSFPDPSQQALFHTWSTSKLLDRVKELNNPYEPKNAVELLQLLEAWERRVLFEDKAELDSVNIVDINDPLWGSRPPDIFGDTRKLRSDARRYVNDAKRIWRTNPGSSLLPIDRLTVRQLVARAKELNDPYSPENAPMLLRLREAWMRKPQEVLLKSGFVDSNKSQSLPPIEIFGDTEQLAIDAQRFNNIPPDSFEQEILQFKALSEEERLRAETEINQEILFLESAADSRGSIEREFSSRGQIETLSDGVRLWNFGVSSARLRPQFRDPLGEIARQALANPHLVISIEAHTSSSGSPKFNQHLSVERALSVRQFLIDTGVPASRILLSGYGEQDLLVGERGSNIPRRMAKNRRVEIHLVSGASTTPLPKSDPVDEDALRRARESGEALGREGGRKLDQSQAEALSDVVYKIDLTNLLAGLIASIAELVVVEAGSIALGVILSFIGLEISLGQAKDSQIQGSKEVGIRLGFKAAKRLSLKELKGTVSAKQLKAKIRNNPWWLSDWEGKKTYSYPIGAEGAEHHMCQGLAKVAQAINKTMRWAEAELRKRLKDEGITSDEIDRIIREEADDLRLRVLVKLIDAGLETLEK